MSTVTGQDITDAFYDKVYALSLGAANQKVYFMEAPLNAALPLLVITVVDTPIARTFDGVSRTYQYQIDLYGARSTGADALGDINRTLFDGLDSVALTVAGHDRGVITCTNDGTFIMEEDAIRILSEWQVEATPT